MADLPFFQGALDKKKATANVKINKIPAICLQPNAELLKYKHMDYVFHIPEEYEKINDNDLTFYKSNKKRTSTISKISVQFIQDIPLDIMQSFQGKEKLEIYCEEFVNKLITGTGVKRAWIMSSASYCKRYNMNMDPASWEGWEIHLRNERRDIIVILLRRKYIPPLFNQFVDIFIFIEGPELTNAAKAKLPKDAKHFESTKQTLSIIRDVADSFYAAFIPPTIYEVIIRHRADALLYDQESLLFFQYRLGKICIKSSAIVYGIGFVQEILNILKAYDKTISALIVMLRTKYADEYETSKDTEMDLYVSRTPLEVIDKLKRKCITVGKQEIEIRNWSFKIAKYFSFCIDGGLLGNNLTFDIFLKMCKSVSKSQDTEMLNKIIDFLLFLCPEKSGFEEFMVQTKIQKMLSKEKFIYNQNIMMILIESKYIEQISSVNEKAGLFTKFLVFLMENADSPFIKLSACIQVIISQSEKKANANSAVVDNMNEIKNITRPLLTLYNGDNIQLAIFSCVALTNLCTKAKDVKTYVMNEGCGKICLDNLNGKSEELLLHTLQLIQLLLTVTQNVNAFVNLGIVDEILRLLNESGIIGVFFSDKILIMICYISRLIVESNSDTKKKFLNKLDIFYRLFTVQRQNYIPDQNLHLEIFNFCLKLITGDNAAKTEFANQFTDTIINQIKSGKITINALKSRALTLLIVVVRDVDNIAMKLKGDNDFEEIISEWMQDFKDKCTELMSLIKSKTEEEKKENHQDNGAKKKGKKK